MTAIIALRGRDHVVIAADTLVIVGDAGGLYKREIHKLRTIDGWIVGVANDMEGAQVIDELDAQRKRWFSKNLHNDVSELAKCSLLAYQEKHWRYQTRFLLAGIHEGKPEIWIWEIRPEPVSDEKDELICCGPTRENHHFSTIGAGAHGALYFADKFHNETASPEQNILLAYHCIAGIAEQDRRVDHPIDIAVVAGEKPLFYTERDLKNFVRKSEEINAILKEMFLSPNLTLPPVSRDEKRR